MSFECQDGASTCGLASLKYAFSLLGAGVRRNREVEEDDVRRLAGKGGWRVLWEGVDEDELDDDMSESTYWLADEDGDLAPGLVLMKEARLRAWIDATEELEDEIREDHGGEPPPLPRGLGRRGAARRLRPGHGRRAGSLIGRSVASSP